MGAATFMQSLPKDGRWTLVNPDKKAGQLLYRNEEGREALVPSVWYNQPVSWRVEYFLFCADRATRNAARLRASRDKHEQRRADDMDLSAVKLTAQADEMKRTGRFPD